MLKFKILSFVAFLSLFALGQQSEGLNSKDITNQKTEKHVRIPGSRLFLDLPKGFTISDVFLGVQLGEEAMIQIYDLEGGNFYSNGRSVNRENFEAKGLKVYDYSEFHLNNYPAKLVYLQAQEPYQSYQLIFGDSTFSVALMGLFNKEDGNSIKKAMFSAYYDKSLEIDPFETAKFTLDESVTRFKFSQYSSNLYFYTTDGKKNEDKFSPSVLISQLPFVEGITFETIVEEAIIGLKQNTFIQTDIISSSEKIINGKKGFEKIVKGYLNRKKVKIYFIAFRNRGNYILFYGISYAEDESDLNDFKKLAESIQLK